MVYSAVDLAVEPAVDLEVEPVEVSVVESAAQVLRKPVASIPESGLMKAHRHRSYPRSRCERESKF